MTSVKIYLVHFDLSVGSSSVQYEMPSFYRSIQNYISYSVSLAIFLKYCLGEKLTNIPSDKEFIEIITLQKDHLDKIRTRLNFLNDQDSFEILD